MPAAIQGRLYQPVREEGPMRERASFDDGAESYAFTFG